MSNKPFISQNTNIFNENKYNTVPGTIGNDSVLITQSSQRRIIDQKSVTITKNETQTPLYYLPTTPTQQKGQQPAVQHGQKEYFPGGITYTFNKINPIQGNQLINNQPAVFNETSFWPPSFQLPSPPLSLEQMIALKQLEQQGLELTLLQERLKRNPYQLRFNQDSTTSTADLIDPLKQTPTSSSSQSTDSNCICGGHSDLKPRLQPSHDDSNCFSSNNKNLVLTKSPDLVKHASTTSNKNDKSSSCDMTEEEIRQDKSDSSEYSEDDYEKPKEKKRKRALKKEQNSESPKKKNRRTKSAKHKKQTSFEENIKHNKKHKSCEGRGTRQKHKIRSKNYTSNTSSESDEEVPGTIGNDSVLITQSSQRQIIDQKSLTITKNETQPPLYYLPTTPTQQKGHQLAVQHGQREYFPGGITYTFNKVNPVQGNQLINNQPTIFNEANFRPPSFQLPSPPLSLEQMIALKQLEEQGLELTLLQERLKRNPYQLKFHQDSITSSSDLLNALNQTPISRGLPDFNCVCGGRSVLKANLHPPTSIVLNNDLRCFSSNNKKLALTKSPDLVKHEPTITLSDNNSDQNNSCDDISGDEIEQEKSDSSEYSDDYENAKEKKRKRASKKEKKPESSKQKSKRTKSAKHKKQTSFRENIKNNKKHKCYETRQKRKIKNRNYSSDSSTESEE